MTTNQASTYVDTDEELLGMDARQVRGIGHWKHGAAALAGLMAIAGCLAVATYSFTATSAQHVSARTLLESRELSDVVTEQLITATGRTHAESGGLRDHVHSGFQDMSQQISQHFPTTARQLDEMQLSPSQKEAVIQSYRSMADPRVLSLGSDILRAASEAKDSASLKERVLTMLQPRAAEIRELGDMILPMAGEQGGRTMDLANVDNLDIVRNFDNWHVELGISEDHISRRMQASMSSAAAGTSQQAQVFMNLLGTMKPDFEVPDLSGMQESIVSDFFSCLSSSISTMALIEAATCASTYFAEAVSFVRSSFGMGGGSTTLA